MKVFRSFNTRILIGATIGIAALLAVLGLLQYRWIGLASQHERELMQADLERILESIRADADREINRFCLLLLTTRAAERSNLQDDLTRAMQRWQAETEWPRMVDAVFWTRKGWPEPTPGQFPSPHYALTRWNSAAHRWEPEALKPLPDDVYFAHETLPLVTVSSGYPPRAYALFDDLSDRVGGFGFVDDSFAGEAPPLESCSPNALWSPCESAPLPTGIRSTMDVIGAHLDTYYLRSELLPHLAEKHFGTSLRDYRVELRGVETLMTYVISNPDAPLMKSYPPYVDAERSVLTVHLEDFKSLIDPEAGQALRDFYRRRETLWDRRNSGWTIQATHRLGSLDAAVKQRRRLYLGVAFGVLSLLGGGTMVAMISALRARRVKSGALIA